jgi:hypothetical protein
MSLNELLQDRIDRRDRENAPDEFSVDAARKQIEAYDEGLRAIQLLAMDIMDGWREAGIITHRLPLLSAATAIRQTLEEEADSDVIGEAIDIIHTANRIEGI